MGGQSSGRHTSFSLPAPGTILLPYASLQWTVCRVRPAANFAVLIQ